MRIVWSEAALRHLRNIFDYLAEFHPQAANRLVLASIDKGESLKHFPHRGRMVSGSTVREITAVQPYVIRYQIMPNHVAIIRVRHGARRPSKP